ncbi:MAG: RDD family protein [Sulfurospirillaceae bacterium]|nr:RDD family protein [Sulfurospirillaceae bacterium]
MTEQELIEKFESENITLASIKSRIFAYTIDELIVSFIFMVIFMEQMPSEGNIESTINALSNMISYVILLKIIYQTFFVWMYGATVGKIIVKIRVVSTVDFENPNIFTSTIRSIVRVFGENLLFIGFFWALLNPKRESWHDMAAQTLVVNVY